MSEKQEDIIFKDVSEEEVDVFLKRLNIKSKKKKLNPTEILYIDVAILIADIIIELDEELIDLSLVPVMSSKNTQEEQIEKSVNLILSINLDNYKVNNLVKSIAYL
ncbi:hypothetical protein TL18_00090 [Methanobrevibacter sp. YE315]|uniref:hypothetical protein n=1 Tax=Methanobrevibacter sp. YE315 TaxID=1609968 RepID=UPI000764D212|nr:hypothetical protein [Methanobrevibacter sp. YE315]AMD16572.1 hypothetical protein TL18_00090 [Methanobrevibacter sp. YE315]